MPFGLTSRTGARGFIVVAVLWILAALSALVLIYLTFVTNTAIVVAGSTDRVRTEALVEAGIELAAFQLAGRFKRFEKVTKGIESHALKLAEHFRRATFPLLVGAFVATHSRHW